MKQAIRSILTGTLMTTLTTLSYASGTHDEGGEEHGHEEQGHSESSQIELTPQQLQLAEIKVEAIYPRHMSFSIYAPGEIKANGYTSYIVSPRVDSVVLKRHVALGDHVTKGQPMVTLFSEVVAEAQANYKVSSAEWFRVKKLGVKSVGDRRFVTAKSEYKAAKSRLLAYGLTEQAIEKTNKSLTNLGEYVLYAAIDGAVLDDDFHQGQRIEAGEPLIDLADEKELWVEARLPANEQLPLSIGSPARVKVADRIFAARVSQEAHTIDPETRTRIVRLLVNNDQHRLHPGLFAEVFFEFETENEVLAVPESALIRSGDGDWTVFIQEADDYKAHEVELGRVLGNSREIIGLEPGTKVVTQGAFYVSSEIAKGGFDPHGH